MPRNFLTVLCIAPLTLGTTTQAASLFDRVDSNRDHRISHREAQSAPELAGQWQQLDRNRDNGLDRNEFSHFIMINKHISWVWPDNKRPEDEFQFSPDDGF